MNTDTQQNNGSTVKTLDLTRFKNAVGFIPQFTCAFGNTRKANIDKVTLNTDAAATQTDETQPVLPEAGLQADEAAAAAKKAQEKAKRQMKVTKQLIVSPEFAAIKAFYGQLQTWIYAQTVPSFFKSGINLASLEAVEIIEKKMRQAAGYDPVSDETETLPKLVAAFVRAYPAQVEEARATLEPVGQFNPLNYPAPSELPAMFRIEWNWVAFTTPEGLPAQLKAQEQEKFAKRMSDAADNITQALRSGFLELITHASETLKPGSDGKKKIFRDSMTGNILDFLETFNRRNITNDVELAQLVGKAKAMLSSVTPQKLRTDDAIREQTAAQFEALKTELSAIVTIQPARAIDLSDE